MLWTHELNKISSIPILMEWVWKCYLQQYPPPYPSYSKQDYDALISLGREDQKS